MSETWMRRLVGEAVEFPGLLSDYVRDLADLLQRLTFRLRRWEDNRWPDDVPTQPAADQSAECVAGDENEEGVG